MQVIGASLLDPEGNDYQTIMGYVLSNSFNAIINDLLSQSEILFDYEFQSLNTLFLHIIYNKPDISKYYFDVFEEIQNRSFFS